MRGVRLAIYGLARGCGATPYGGDAACASWPGRRSAARRGSGVPAAGTCCCQPGVRDSVRLRLHLKEAVRLGSVGSRPLTSTLPARSCTGTARAGPSHEARSTLRAALRQEQHVQHASPVLRVHRRRVRGGSQRLRSGHPRALAPQTPLQRQFAEAAEGCM